MRYFLDRSIATVRRARKIDANRSAYSATGTAYQVGIQDMRPELAQVYNGEIGRTFNIYCDDTAADIQTGDQVIIANVTYNIQGKRTIDFGGAPFIRLVGIVDTP